METDYAKPIEMLDAEGKLLRFREWFKLSSEAFAEFRKLALEDIKFQIPKNQWPEGTDRKGRPTIEVDLLRHPKQIVQNQASQANIGVELSPVSPDADDELAEIKQGLYARSQRDGGAKTARMWAVDYAKQAGLGWYRITTQYDEDSDDETDQEIVYERILHQEMVYPDPAAQKADFSDGRFLFLAAYVPVESIGIDYDEAKFTTKEAFGEGTIKEPGWVLVEDGKCSVLLVECFYKVSRVGGKKRPRPVVHRAVLTGREILEDKPYLAPMDRPEEGRRYIPFVPVIGNELQPIEGKRYWEGMVRTARGAQIAHNFFASTLVESVAKEPKSPVVGYAESFQPYLKLWEELATGNPAFLPVAAAPDGNGGFLPLPQRMQADQGHMSIALLALGQSKDWVESTTAFNPPSLGEAPRRRDAQSGRAIQALQGATEAGTSQYMDNLETISLPLDARIWLDMAPVIYDRPGRAAQVLGAETNKSRAVILNAPFVEMDGKPVPVSQLRQPVPADQIKQFDLSKGRYSVVPRVGKPPQTRMEKGQEFLTNVIGAAPELMPVIGDLVFEYRDEPGAKQIAERLRRQIQATNPGLLDEGKDGAAQAQAKATALQAQVQAMQGELQKAADYIKTEQAKHEAQTQQVLIKEQAATEREHMKNATSIAVAQINAAAKGYLAETEAQNEALATGLKAVHEAREMEKDRAHEAHLHHAEHAHEVAMAAAGANTVTRTTEGGQETGEEHTREQGQEASRTDSQEVSTSPQGDGSGD